MSTKLTLAEIINLKDDQARIDFLSAYYADRLHPVNRPFPWLKGDEYKRMYSDIKQHGVLDPIWKDENGLIIDGKNRLAIASGLGITCPFKTCKSIELPDIARVAVARNLVRHQYKDRELTIALSAIADIKSRGIHRDPKSGMLIIVPDNTGEGSGVTAKEAATLAGVSLGKVYQERNIANKVIEPAQAAYREGRLTQTAVTMLSKLPKDEQEKAFTPVKNAADSIGTKKIPLTAETIKQAVPPTVVEEARIPLTGPSHTYSAAVTMLASLAPYSQEEIYKHLPKRDLPEYQRKQMVALDWLDGMTKLIETGLAKPDDAGEQPSAE